jgi:hypothetical protein
MYSNVRNIEKKSGKFEYLFCVGEFFSESKDFNGACSKVSEKYLLGQRDSKLFLKIKKSFYKNVLCNRKK